MLKKLPITALTLTLLFTALFTLVCGASGADVPIYGTPQYVYDSLFNGEFDPEHKPLINTPDGIPYKYTMFFAAPGANGFLCLSSDCQELIFVVDSYLYDGDRYYAKAHFNAEDGSPVVVSNGTYSGLGNGEYGIAWGYFREANNTFIRDSRNTRFSYRILSNDFIITDVDGDDLDKPIVKDTFNADFTVLSNRVITSEVYSNVLDYYECEFYVCPNPYGSAAETVVKEFYKLFDQFQSVQHLPKDDSTRVGIELEFFDFLHLHFPDVEVPIPDFELAFYQFKSAFTSDTTEEDYTSLLSQVTNIQRTAYPYYNGSNGGQFNRVDRQHFGLIIDKFYSSVRYLPQYNDNNTIYVVIYGYMRDGLYSRKRYPIDVLSYSFKVSDFYPTKSSEPPMTTPDPSVVDPDDKYPEGRTEDWTIYQHAMYMRYLLDNLKLTINYPEFDMIQNSTWDVSAEYDYTYKPIDYETDVELTDYAFTAIDPADPTISSTFTLFPKLLTKSVEATGLTKMLALMVSISVIAWFIYGRK